MRDESGKEYGEYSEQERTIIFINLLKKYSSFYHESTRLFFVGSLSFFILLILGYTVYFFYKFFVSKKSEDIISSYEAKLSGSYTL